MGLPFLHQLVDLALAVDGDAVFQQKLRRDAVAGRARAGERAVINFAPATGRAALLSLIHI